MYFSCRWAKTPFCWHWTAFFWNRTCRDEPHGYCRQVREHRAAPEAKRRLQKAIKFEWITLALLTVSAALVFLVLGNSQAMKAAWIEDLLSVLPPIAFLLAVRLIRRPPTKKHPYGYHRSVGIAHLVAAMALVAMGAFLIVDSGAGLWWADYAAALLISISILRDGVKNLRGAVGALIDTQAHTVDDSAPDPLNRRFDIYLKGLPWVSEAASRIRDEGHVFHIESFVVPAEGRLPSLKMMEEARKACAGLDWKVQDIIIVPVAELPEEFLPGLRAPGAEY